MSPQVAGPIQQVYVKDGARVTRGQLLFRIDPAPFRVALEQAQRRIEKSEADLRKAEAAGDAKKIKTAQRKLDSARHAFAEIRNSPL